MERKAYIANETLLTEDVMVNVKCCTSCKTTVKILAHRAQLAKRRSEQLTRVQFFVLRHKRMQDTRLELNELFLTAALAHMQWLGQRKQFEESIAEGLDMSDWLHVRATTLVDAMTV